MNKIDELLQQVNKLLLDHDNYESGIPFYNEKVTNGIQDAVKQFLVTELNELEQYIHRLSLQRTEADEQIAKWRKEKGYEV